MKMLNKWQRENSSILNYAMIELIKKGQYARAGTSLLHCVSCGKCRITGPIVEYFDFNARGLRCYECQKVLKVSNSKRMYSVNEILQTNFINY